jgi:hypothetical protein
MHPSTFRTLCAGALLASAAAAGAAPLTPNTGALAMAGTVTGYGNAPGKFTVQAVLRQGNFTGTGSLEIGGQVVSGPLVEKRSYLENGKCYFRFENGRAHAGISGKCDSAGLDGRFEAFLPTGDMNAGPAKASVTLGGGAPSGGAPVAEQAGRVPTGKLMCAFNEPKIGIKMGELTEYTLRYSNMVSLTLAPGGSYAAGKSTRGSYVVQGGKVRLTSGTWAGAVGTLENDRSGAPAVVFHIEDNRRADGVHIVDPYTTRCTAPR